MAKSSKGGQFERDISRYISQWITGDKDCEPLIWRSAGSGAQATFSRRRGKAVQKNLEGDLIAIDERANFFMDVVSIECKTGYKTANIFTTFKETKTDVLRKFWEQAYGQAKSSKKWPMLIFKPLGNKVLMGVIPEFLNIYFHNIKLEHYVQISFNTQLPPLLLIEMDTFFKGISPEQFREAQCTNFIFGQTF